MSFPICPRSRNPASRTTQCRWFASFAAAKTPKAAVSQLAAWLTAALQAPEIEQKLLIQGLYPARLCGDELAAYLRDQFDDFGRIIRESNIKAE